MPKAFSLPEQQEAVDRLKSISRERAQLILDELAARMKAESIRNLLGYLGALIKRERNGAFQPELAHQHARDRDIRERNLAAQRLREKNPTVASVTTKSTPLNLPSAKAAGVDEAPTTFRLIGQHIDLPGLTPGTP